MVKYRKLHILFMINAVHTTPSVFIPSLDEAKKMFHLLFTCGSRSTCGNFLHAKFYGLS